MENYKVEARFCQRATKCDDKTVKGTWTMIYDQALQVDLNNGIKFYNNFKYTIKPEISKDPANDKNTGFKAIDSS